MWLCILHPMQGCTALTQQWGWGSAQVIHTKSKS